MPPKSDIPTTTVKIKIPAFEIVRQEASKDDRTIMSMLSKIVTEWAEMKQAQPHSNTKSQ